MESLTQSKIGESRFTTTSSNSLPGLHMKSTSRHIVALLLALSFCGCESEKPKFPFTSVDGEVTIDGAAVKEGTLQFMPAPGTKGQVAQANIVDGKFAAKNVPIGKLRVMFNITRKTGKMITEYSTPYPEVEDMVPEQYRSGIEVTVNEKDTMAFNLESKPAESK